MLQQQGQKPKDGSDLKDLETARREIMQLRSVLSNQFSEVEELSIAAKQMEQTTQQHLNALQEHTKNAERLEQQKISAADAKLRRMANRPSCKLRCDHPELPAAGEIGSMNTPAKDCEELKSKESGSYYIAGHPAAAVYCNSADEGGGWTLLMKLDAGSSAFRKGSVLWTDQQPLLNEREMNAFTSEGRGDAKFKSFNNLAAREFMVAWPDQYATWAPIGPFEPTTAMELFNRSSENVTSPLAVFWSPGAEPSLEQAAVGTSRALIYGRRGEEYAGREAEERQARAAMLGIGGREGAEECAEGSAEGTCGASERSRCASVLSGDVGSDSNGSCEKCVTASGGGCAWCAGSRSCVPDQAWQCVSATEHVSSSGEGFLVGQKYSAEACTEANARAAAHADAAGEGARGEPLLQRSLVAWEMPVTNGDGGDGAAQANDALAAAVAAAEQTQKEGGKPPQQYVWWRTARDQRARWQQQELERVRAAFQQELGEEKEQVDQASANRDAGASGAGAGAAAQAAQAAQTAQAAAKAKARRRSRTLTKAGVQKLKERAKWATDGAGLARPLMVLGLSKGTEGGEGAADGGSAGQVSQSAVRAAYASLSRQYHPDACELTAAVHAAQAAEAAEAERGFDVPTCTEHASKVFADLVAAFDTVGSWRRREAFSAFISQAESSQSQADKTWSWERAHHWNYDIHWATLHHAEEHSAASMRQRDPNFADSQPFDSYSDYADHYTRTDAGTTDSSGRAGRFGLTADDLITPLSSAAAGAGSGNNNWSESLSGDSVWVLLFYRPSQPSARGLADTWRQLARSLAGLAGGDGEQELEGARVEVGAIDCEREAGLCDRNGIEPGQPQPSIKIANRRQQLVVDYSMGRERDQASLESWARTVAGEWRWLLHHSNVTMLVPSHEKTTPEFMEEETEEEPEKVVTANGFEESVMASEEFWVVLFTDGLDCPICKIARTNMLRLSASLKGQAMVGIFDCSQGGMLGAEEQEQLGERAKRLCYEEMGIAAVPHPPTAKAWRRGKKRAGDKGETLYNAKMFAPHLALKLIERAVRLAGADRQQAKGENSRAGGVDFEAEEEEAAEEEDEPDAPPQRPPDQEFWEEGDMPQREAIAWDSQFQPDQMLIGG
jgi:hypothetical protein